MERLIFVPIERLEERYSSQWFGWFMEGFLDRGITPIVVGDLAEQKIKVGQFLDVYETNLYKMNQIQEIIYWLMKYPDDNFTIFFMDLWFPGIEALAYIRDGAKRNIKIKGMLHAGTWDQWDFLSQSGMEPWARPFEQSFSTIADEIFMATKFHADLMMGSGIPCRDKFTFVDWPVIDPVPRNPNKENIVVFPHRMAPEKAPEEFTVIETVFKENFKNIPNVKFIRTKDVCKTKAEYYDLLNRSKVAVSCAYQETFGIAMIEALHHWCYPIVPDRLSYSEMYDEEYKYKRLEQAAAKIAVALQTYDSWQPEFKYSSKINWIGRILA